MKYNILLSLIILCFPFTLVFGQDRPTIDPLKYFDENKRWYNEFTEHWFYFFDIPDDQVRASIEHWSKIGEDLETSTNSAEGTYGNGGDTHGDYLRWSEKSGFIWLNVNKCNGGPMKITRGRVLRTPTSFKFIPDIVLGISQGHGHHSSDASQIEFLAVKWRKSDYFIQRNKLANFADYTAGLNPETSGLYDENWYFTKVLQHQIGSINELPIFPPGFEKYVKSPIKTKILSIGKSYRRSKPIERDEKGQEIEDWHDDLVTEVKIDAGKSSGIAPGVLIRFLNEKDDYQIDGVAVKKVYERYSIGEYVRDIPNRNCRKSEYEKCEVEEGKKLKVGMKLSTTGEW